MYARMWLNDDAKALILSEKILVERKKAWELLYKSSGPMNNAIMSIPLGNGVLCPLVGFFITLRSE